MIIERGKTERLWRGSTRARRLGRSPYLATIAGFDILL